MFGLGVRGLPDSVTCLPVTEQLALLAFDLLRPESTESCLECLVVVAIHTTIIFKTGAWLPTGICQSPLVKKS